MDLRVQKTLENIEAAFLALCAKAPLNRVKVNDVCLGARINKSTFYRHYADIFDLSDRIENQTIDLVMQDFTAVDLLFTKPEEFISGLLMAIEPYNRKILLLFSDRMDILASKMEVRLKSHYLTTPCSLEEDITLSFLIGGAAHVFLNPKYDLDTETKTLAALLRSISSNRF